MRIYSHQGALLVLVTIAAAGGSLGSGCSAEDSQGTGGAAGSTASGGAGATGTAGGSGGMGGAGGAGGAAHAVDCLALCSHLASCTPGGDPSAIAAFCNPECAANTDAAQECAHCLGALSGEDCSNVPPCSSVCDPFVDLGGSGDAG